jgi:hypothetical protein
MLFILQVFFDHIRRMNSLHRLGSDDILVLRSTHHRWLSCWKHVVRMSLCALQIHFIVKFLVFDLDLLDLSDGKRVGIHKLYIYVLIY